VKSAHLAVSLHEIGARHDGLMAFRVVHIVL
jgi:hypothetical protein